MAIRVITFLILNFAALGIGGLFTGTGVTSDWYNNLSKAPWTPPGWTFGAAWTTIMVCFAFYMAYLWPSVQNKKLLVSLFSFQWILNVLWNPVFFYFQNPLLGIIVISSLTILVGVFLFKYYSTLKSQSVFILPYLLWLIIATSLNAYILIYN
ncbi:TspO/MBR family protein [Gelidibacter japonicus]|uniref:TspO/MBR family protein n=1 Tax=Gelidibacter japonicus TaxID=1962232 RepID=UPI003A93A497